MEMVYSYEQIKDLLGTEIVYNDYLGMSRSGSIAWAEPYITPDNDGSVAWLYIADTDLDYNNKTIIVNFGSMQKPDMREIHYADMRLSTEISIDK